MAAYAIFRPTVELTVTKTAVHMELDIPNDDTEHSPIRKQISCPNKWIVGVVQCST